jgi:hypothetical protein
MGEMRMSSKERKRLGIMVRIDAGEIRLKDVSNILGISYRHIKVHGPFPCMQPIILIRNIAVELAMDDSTE